MNKLKLVLAVVAFCTTASSYASLPNSVGDKASQQYLVSAQRLQYGLRKCSDTSDPFSTTVTTCLKQATAAIEKELVNIDARQSKLAPDEVGSIHSLAKRQALTNAFNADCSNTYPEPLREAFKNQILQCQAYVQINFFFKAATNRYNTLGEY